MDQVLVPCGNSVFGNPMYCGAPADMFPPTPAVIPVWRDARTSGIEIAVLCGVVTIWALFCAKVFWNGSGDTRRLSERVLDVLHFERGRTAFFAAKKHFKDEHFEEAIAAATRGLSSDPRDEFAHHLQLVVHGSSLKKGRYSEARAAAIEALKYGRGKEKLRDELLVGIIHTFVAEDNLDQAVQFAKQVDIENSSRELKQSIQLVLLKPCLFAERFEEVNWLKTFDETFFLHALIAVSGLIITGETEIEDQDKRGKIIAFLLQDDSLPALSKQALGLREVVTRAATADPPGFAQAGLWDL